MSLVLGLMHHTHDAAAALVDRDRVLAAVEEERVSREKHTSAFPAGAIGACLALAHLRFREIEHVAYPWRPDRRALYGLWFALSRFPGSLRVVARRRDGDVGALLTLPGRLRAYARERGEEPDFKRFHFVDHHLAHAAYAWTTSPFDRGLVVTHDFCGEYHSVFAGMGEGDRVRPLFRLAYPDSMGFVYSAVTHYLGFARNCDEGKVMGLAPYGDERFVAEFERMVELLPDGRFRLDPAWFDIFFYDLATGGDSALVTERFIRRFGPPRRPGEPLTDDHRAVARAVQALLERVVLHLVGTLVKRERTTDACLAGGVALNACANGRLLSDGIVRRLHVPPAAGDAGAALGAAMLVRRTRLGERGRLPADPFLGPEFSDAAAARALEAAGVPFERTDDPAGAAAAEIARGGVVGWFQGRMEFGPRALGHRSLLADPRDPAMRDRLNLEIKHRETFRPYAPSVAAEDFPAWFDATGSSAAALEGADGAPGTRPPQESPFMLKVFPVRRERRAQVPAITHVDGTARVQTVTAAADPLYHSLIRKFAGLTGVPMVLNTSFNDRGEPIVATPEDAVRYFAKSRIDALVIGRLVARRPI